MRERRTRRQRTGKQNRFGPPHSFGHAKPFSSTATVELVNEFKALLPAATIAAIAVASLANTAASSALLRDERIAAVVGRIFQTKEPAREMKKDDKAHKSQCISVQTCLIGC